MMEFIGVDLFAGAGGVTTGIENAKFDGERIAQVIAVINHDETAIDSHWRNHPSVKHFVEDIRTFNVDKLPFMPITEKNVRTFIWASLECTNFSNAKGGLPRDPDSRTLADHLKRYIIGFKPEPPDYIIVENVREFRDWGPLDKYGKPIKSRKGEDYKRWIKEIEVLGYVHEEKILNAADYGAYTSRRRLFIIFAREGLPIAFPEPTHSRNPESGLLPWIPVKEVLDLENEGESIFDRETRGRKPLVQKTLDRIVRKKPRILGAQRSVK